MVLSASDCRGLRQSLQPSTLPFLYSLPAVFKVVLNSTGSLLTLSNFQVFFIVQQSFCIVGKQHLLPSLPQVCAETCLQSLGEAVRAQLPQNCAGYGIVIAGEMPGGEMWVRSKGCVCRLQRGGLSLSNMFNQVCQLY